MANVKIFDETIEEYDSACEAVRKENAEYLKLFEADLTEKGLSPKTIKNHISNVDLFINEFLLREDAQPIETGIDNLDPFFYFYIHKCMWSTPASVRSMAAGLKKFYKCMAEHEIIEEED
ncbi:MAG: hypothetical protein UFA98_03450, partial [Ruminococcus sp.]|nr:hypothetical protein [Ruminococcus sp.]